jgi:hypothetical protein
MGQGGSFEIGSQIFPDFVQAQIVIQYFCVKFIKAIDINDYSPEFVPPSCNMQAVQSRVTIAYRSRVANAPDSSVNEIADKPFVN